MSEEEGKNALLTRFSSTYSSEKFLSSMNFVKSNNRNKLWNELTAKFLKDFKNENQKKGVNCQAFLLTNFRCFQIIGATYLWPTG